MGSVFFLNTQFYFQNVAHFNIWSGFKNPHHLPTSSSFSMSKSKHSTMTDHFVHVVSKNACIFAQSPRHSAVISSRPPAIGKWTCFGLIVHHIIFTHSAELAQTHWSSSWINIRHSDTRHMKWCKYLLIMSLFQMCVVSSNAQT